ncbi:FAD-binding protein [Nannocystis sp.]|uniref:FAD-binding protein n=1 Tax=Nannocystis sp. TaxID=1962667 RepID=UPI00344D100C
MVAAPGRWHADERQQRQHRLFPRMSRHIGHPAIVEERGSCGNRGRPRASAPRRRGRHEDSAIARAVCLLYSRRPAPERPGFVERYVAGERLISSTCGEWSNWAGNLHCAPREIVRPETREELQSAVRRAAGVRVVGAGHSWSALGCTDQILIDTRSLTKVLALDEANQRITVEAGILLADLDEAVAGRGLALATEPSIAEITAAGAISTASHGTGLAHGAFSEEVVALEVLGCGENPRFSIATRPPAHARRRPRSSSPPCDGGPGM